MQSSDFHASTPAPVNGFYTPGYAGAKIAMIIYGLALIFLSAMFIEEPVSLILFGRKAQAEATKVIVAKSGRPDLVLATDEQINERLVGNDYSLVYWNEFEFQTEDGQTHVVRCPIGSRLKPLYPLLDPDGLPTVARIYYNSSRPEQVVFPFVVSTWFLPGALVVAGLLGSVIGGFLYYWARRPIALPHLPPAKNKEGLKDGYR